MRHSYQESGPDVEPTSSPAKMRTELGTSLEEIADNRELELRQQYLYRSLGRNQRLRVKLGRCDAVLANETGWLSRVCLSALAVAVSIFLDSVAVQRRDSFSELLAGNSTRSSQPITRTPAERVMARQKSKFMRKQERHD